MKRVFLRGEASKLVNYTAALAACGVESVVSRTLSDAQCCDGLLLPGGADADPACYGQENIASHGIDRDRDRDEFWLIEQFRKRNRPILGICRGHQMLNIALGGTLVQDLPDERHLPLADGADRIHTVTTLHPFLAERYGERFAVNSAHHQAVDRLGEGLLPTCVSEDGVIEGFVHAGEPMIGVQFHPERMSFSQRRAEAADGAEIFRAFVALL